MAAPHPYTREDLDALTLAAERLQPYPVLGEAIATRIESIAHKVARALDAQPSPTPEGRLLPGDHSDLAAYAKLFKGSRSPVRDDDLSARLKSLADRMKKHVGNVVRIENPDGSAMVMRARSAEFHGAPRKSKGK